MIDLLGNLLSTIVLIIQSAINTLTSTFTILSHVPTYAQFLYTAVGMLPNSILIFASTSVSIYVVLFIIGRN